MDKTQIDLLNLIGKDTVLKRRGNTRGGEWKGSCPFCGGKDRFWVHPGFNGGEFKCRQCGVGGDAITYVMRLQNCDFKRAAELLGLPLDQQPRRDTVRRVPLPENAAPTLGEYIALEDADWQESARQFCEWSFEQLWSKDGRKALDWLKARGIPESTIESAGLGFNPTDANAQWGLTDVFLDRGIVIPWIIGNKFWRVNIRRPIGEPKYRGVKGGANGLYNADAIGRDDVVLMTEGEFDCLVIQSYVKGITPVATGAMSWARVVRWTTLVASAQSVLLAFDVDENGAGDKAAAWWAGQVGAKAVRLVPTEHDITDMWAAGCDLQTWVEPHSLWHEYPTTDRQMKERLRIRQEMANKGWRLAGVY